MAISQESYLGTQEINKGVKRLTDITMLDQLVKMVHEYDNTVISTQIHEVLMELMSNMSQQRQKTFFLTV